MQLFLKEDQQWLHSTKNLFTEGTVKIRIRKTTKRQKVKREGWKRKITEVNSKKDKRKGKKIKKEKQKSQENIHIFFQMFRPGWVEERGKGGWKQKED